MNSTRRLCCHNRYFPALDELIETVCDKSFIIIEEESPRIPHRGWAEMIRKVNEVNPMTCPRCQAEMRVIAFITDHAVVDRIIDHLKLTFVAERPTPPHVGYQEILVAGEAPADYFS